MKNLIPFSSHPIINKDLKYASLAIKSSHTFGDGPYSKKSEKLLKKILNTSGKILLTTSCTHALEIAALLTNLRPGDEVIVPSYTFVSSALAFYMHGAKIIFADIRQDTLNIDEKKIENLITKKTKAIIVVHYAGVSCEMNKIMKIAKKNYLYVIEDNAHGLFGKYYNKELGTIGHMSAFSFHQTKNLSCGEGGALLLNKSNLIERAQIIREKGTNRYQFLKGSVNKYRWIDKGSSYVLSDILAGILFNQLKNSKKIQSKRKKLWNIYHENLSSWCKINRVLQPKIPAHCKHPYHMYYLLFPNFILRKKFINHLSKLNIKVSSHYEPLHSSPFAKKINTFMNDTCPIATNVSQRIVRLPFFYNITKQQYSRVIDKVTEFSCV